MRYPELRFSCRPQKQSPTRGPPEVSKGAAGFREWTLAGRIGCYYRGVVKACIVPEAVTHRIGLTLDGFIGWFARKMTCHGRSGPDEEPPNVPTASRTATLPF